MPIYLTTRSLPELGSLTDAQLEFVRENCLAPLFRRRWWLPMIPLTIFGSLGDTFGAYFSNDAMGGRVLGIYIGCALGGFVGLHLLHAASRSRVQQFLASAKEELNKYAP